jgi:hypothetical protein
MLKNKAFTRFLVSCLILSFLCLVAAFCIQYMLLPEKSFTGVYFLIAYVALVTILFHYSLMKASVINPRNFVGKFVAYSGIKLMLYLISILLYVFTIKNEVHIFMLGFLLTYLLFTILEVSAILKFLKKSSP